MLSHLSAHEQRGKLGGGRPEDKKNKWGWGRREK